MEMNLKEFKKNILSWYPIQETQTVLQIGKDEEITSELKTKSNQVRIIDNFRNQLINEKFDFVTIIGGFEKLHTEKEVIELVVFAKQVLKEDGKILLAMQNKFGMKYWSGQKANEREKSYATIENVQENILSLPKIKQILCNQELKFKIYYPLPDYHFTNVIYTDEFLPDNESIDARDLTYCEYDEVLSFSERAAYKQLLNEDKNLFPFFANSYFIEISKKENFEDIKYVSYSISRKKEYRIKTIMRKNYVYKKANGNEANLHIQNVEKNIDILSKMKINCLDKYENDTIMSKYLYDAKSFHNILMDIYQKEGLHAVIEKIKQYKFVILDKLLEKLDEEESKNDKEQKNTIFEKYNLQIKPGLKAKLHFTKNGIIDLIFQNCLVKENQFFIYDQEWYEENVPVEFILYRALFYFTELKNAENMMEIYKKFGLEEYTEIFEELENRIQENILDKDMWYLHANSIKDIGSMDQIVNDYKKRLENAQSHISDLENVIKQYQDSIEELNIRIKTKDTELENYANSLRAISNSVSWKITKPLREISEKLKRKSKGN